MFWLHLRFAHNCSREAGRNLDVCVKVTFDEILLFTSRDIGRAPLFVAALVSHWLPMERKLHRAITTPAHTAGRLLKMKTSFIKMDKQRSRPYIKTEKCFGVGDNSDTSTMHFHIHSLPSIDPQTPCRYRSSKKNRLNYLLITQQMFLRCARKQDLGLDLAFTFFFSPVRARLVFCS